MLRRARARRKGGKHVTIIHMSFLAIFGMRLLEVMFFLGMAGSTVVIIISFIEDARELFGDDEEPPQAVRGKTT
jgi:hypothetical protein